MPYMFRMCPLRRRKNFSCTSFFVVVKIERCTVHSRYVVNKNMMRGFCWRGVSTSTDSEMSWSVKQSVLILLIYVRSSYVNNFLKVLKTSQ